MGTKRDIQAGAEPCYTNAHEDEPLFILRAMDELSSDCVREWCRVYYSAKVADRTPPRNASPEELAAFQAEQARRLEKHGEALRAAGRIDAYRRAYNATQGTEEERRAAGVAGAAQIPGPQTPDPADPPK